MHIDEEDFEDYIQHYGTPRHSGRYPWGSHGWGDGVEDPGTYQRNSTLLDDIERLEKQGLSQVDVARGLGMSTTQLRKQRSNEKARIREEQRVFVQRLKDNGWSPAAISQRTGIPDSNVRVLLAPGAKDKHDNLEAIKEAFRKEVAEKEFVDVGKFVELHMGITKVKKDNAIQALVDEGYELHTLPIPFIGTGQDVRFRVLTKHGNTQRDVFDNRDKIQQVSQVSEDGGRTFGGLHPPLKIDSKRVGIVYKDQGGGEADGVMYVRPGVPDVALGGKTYAQVRVAVGDGHYLKGMAMYKEDLPPGIDIQFNTNKSDTGNKLDVMKEVGEDPANPFGAFISRQVLDHIGTPQEKVTSVMNIVNEEGDWEKWSRTLSSQFLSKQSPQLAKTQLDMTFERRQNEFNQINEMTNATVKKRLLEDFADATDSAAVELKAVNLPRQAQRAILPLSSIKPTEVYAPGFSNGERVVLIRHPHAGPFEIPELIVNNNNREGKKSLGNEPRDAIGIHHTVASKLSGADFDGDTVLVIPDREGKIKIAPSLADLETFDPVREYPEGEGTKILKNKQTEMGKISNLITDMSLAGAPLDEITRAVKHSMVVIDAEKKRLNYTQSYIDNAIGDLKRKYQMSPSGRVGAAATLISRARGEIDIPERRLRKPSEGGHIDPTTGALVFVPTGRKDTRKKSGLKEVKVERLSVTPDAMSLVSDRRHPMEVLYANHSNKLKALSNKARLGSLVIKEPKQSPTARKTYEKERASLDAKLYLAQRNAPLERQANLIANTAIRQRTRANPEMDKDTKRKIKFQQLAAARARMGADKTDIKITDDEWTAIQAGAISKSKLNDILNHSDMAVVREHATPRHRLLMTDNETSRAKAMLAQGFTRADVAKQLGVSLSTLDNATSGRSNE